MRNIKRLFLILTAAFSIVLFITSFAFASSAGGSEVKKFSASELRQMSAFLSSFTKLGFIDFDMRTRTDEENLTAMIWFGIWHNYINDSKRIVICRVRNCKWGSLTIKGKYVAEVIKKYFNVDCKEFTSITESGHTYHYDGKSYHFEGTEGEGVYRARVDKASQNESGEIIMTGELYNADDKNDIPGKFEAVAKPHIWGKKRTWAIISIKTISEDIEDIGDIAKPVSGDETLPASADIVKPVSDDKALPVSGDKTLPVSVDKVESVSGDKTLPVSADIVKPVRKNKALPVSAEKVKSFSYAELQRMSEFLTNFTELGFMEFNVEDITNETISDDIVRFAIWHNYVNNKKRIYGCKVKNCKWGSMTIKGRHVTGTIKRFFDVNYTNHKGITESEPNYRYDGRSYHFEGADGGVVYHARVFEASRNVSGQIIMTGVLYSAEDENDILGKFEALAKPYRFNRRNTWAIISFKIK